ncbi:hypothetical protein MRX96_003153 [Rhipicephalus microplus]
MGCKRSTANGVTVPGATRSCRRRPRATRVYQRPTHNQSARLLRLPRMSLALPVKIRAATRPRGRPRPCPWSTRAGARCDHGCSDAAEGSRHIATRERKPDKRQACCRN